MEFSDATALNLASALATELILSGEKGTELLSHPSLTEDELVTLMKNNTFLTVFAMYLLKVVKEEMPDVARHIMEIWTSEKLKPLISVAFAEEIDNATQFIEDGIAEIERIANKEVD